MLQQVQLLAASSQQPQHAHLDAAYYEVAERFPAAVSISDPPETSGLLDVDAHPAMAQSAGGVLAMAASAGTDWKVCYMVYYSML